VTAEKAFTTRNREWNHNAIPGRDPRDTAPRFFDCPHELVTQNVTGLHPRNLASVDVQVRSTDGCRRDAQDDVVVLFDNRIGDGLDADVPGCVIGERLHG